MAEKQKSALSDKKMVMRAIKDSFIKLKPKTQAGNPVMLLVYISAALTTLLWLISLIAGVGDAPTGYTGAIAVILWFTVLFANFAEAIAEGRGKAQADSLRKAKKDVEAHKIPSPDKKEKIEVIIITLYIFCFFSKTGRNSKSYVSHNVSCPVSLPGTDNHRSFTLRNRYCRYEPLKPGKCSGYERTGH